ncbi:SDR family oxidoreductase [Corynebacterium terpenotabidum]|uniref:3-ketoacyl-(Acyl-carrier-protein) reductase n=1 Tax=Corynebacterium terpenotabidum Y-11 TaxID=1200352 RepID=S4XC01_9CORY|nr:SDR family oxidoreductase [Corynebacterium terpenotabidum]AGP29979.1 3-ketoacyl-(acyl-carrier-protein) reductase [Corynebacterium terpenotabidum Y-11]
MTTYDFSGRTAVVTGGSRGIGYATASLLAASGATVFLTSRTREDAEAAAAQITADLADRGVTVAVTGLAGHVGQADAATAVCTTAVATTGRLDVLVNNAGTNPAYGPVTDQDPALIAKVFEINTTAPVVWARAALEAGLGAAPDGAAGAIVNIASIGALTMEDGIGIYNGSKAALLHLTRQMARELGPRIRVNSVSPGVVRTRFAEALWKEHEAAVAATTPMGRIGEPADIADAVCFLAAPTSGWITGTNLVIDGGQLVGTVGHQ